MLPERENLPLSDAARRLAEKSGVSEEAAREALAAAFRDGVLRPWGYKRRDPEMSEFPDIGAWRTAKIDWGYFPGRLAHPLQPL